MVGDGHEVYEVIPHIYEDKLRHSGKLRAPFGSTC